MREGIESKEKKMKCGPSVTVMFRGSAAESFMFGWSRAQLSSAWERTELLVVEANFNSEFSQSHSLNVLVLRECTLNRTQLCINKSSADKPLAVSASAALTVTRNNDGAQGARNQTTKMTEQRRCVAA